MNHLAMHCAEDSATHRELSGSGCHERRKVNDVASGYLHSVWSVVIYSESVRLRIIVDNRELERIASVNAHKGRSCLKLTIVEPVYVSDYGNVTGHSCHAGAWRWGNTDAQS